MPDDGSGCPRSHWWSCSLQTAGLATLHFVDAAAGTMVFAAAAAELVQRLTHPCHLHSRCSEFRLKGLLPFPAPTALWTLSSGCRGLQMSPHNFALSTDRGMFATENCLWHKRATRYRAAHNQSSCPTLTAKPWRAVAQMVCSH